MYDLINLVQCKAEVVIIINKIPVLVTSFIRPVFLQNIINIIERRNDIDLFFATDGPRNSYDQVKINECLHVLKQSKLRTNKKNTLIHTQNYGTKFGLIKNINWFFSINKFGIVLEDDCLPNDQFFDVLGEGLQKNIKSSKYMMISGADFLPVNLNKSNTFFRESNFPMVWGWGSWANKWSLYRLNIPDIKIIVGKMANKIFGPKSSIDKLSFIDTFRMRFTEVGRGKINTWDYSLMATAWRNELVCLQTNYNMIINMGFGIDAAHTSGKKPEWVPTKFIKQSTQIKNDAVDSEVLVYEKWIAKNVYKCRLDEVLKTQIKRSLRI